MFSGIHSLIFGKKHHRHQQTVDDSAADKASPSDNSFVVIERRHSSDEPDVKPELYPKIDPSDGSLPYGISPSLPDLRPQNNMPTKKEGTTDFLHGVPFELASYIGIMTKEKDDKFAKFLEKTQDVLSEDMISEGFSYDFNLEERVLSEFQT